MNLPDPRELASHGDVSRNFSEILGRFEGEDPVPHVLVVSHSKIVAAVVPIDRYRGLAGAGGASEKAPAATMGDVATGPTAA